MSGKLDKITNDFWLYPLGFKGSFFCLKHVYPKHPLLSLNIYLKVP
jgi:hypothetical protein